MSEDKDARIADLQARVKYLEDIVVTVTDVLKEREELREEVVRKQRILERADRERDELWAQLGEANEKLAAQKPAEPTIVKQRWQNIYDGALAGSYGVGEFRGSRELCQEYREAGCIGVIRRDHYSDGTVRAILEPIEQGENG